MVQFSQCLYLFSDLFVFYNMWVQNTHIKDLEARMAFVYKKASKATFHILL